jgi:hypothetical protein
MMMEARDKADGAKFIHHERFFGRMNDPTSSSYLQGPCGDAMEFYLVVEEGRITIQYKPTDANDESCAAMLRAAFHKTNQRL